MEVECNFPRRALKETATDLKWAVARQATLLVNSRTGRPPQGLAPASCRSIQKRLTQDKTVPQGTLGKTQVHEI